MEKNADAQEQLSAFLWISFLSGWAVGTDPLEWNCSSVGPAVPCILERRARASRRSFLLSFLFHFLIVDDVKTHESDHKVKNNSFNCCQVMISCVSFLLPLPLPNIYR